jgi:hypothetical protein
MVNNAIMLAANAAEDEPRCTDDLMRISEFSATEMLGDAARQHANILLRFTPAEPFVAKPDDVMLPPGFFVTAERAHSLFSRRGEFELVNIALHHYRAEEPVAVKKPFDSVKLEKSLKSALSNIGRPPIKTDICRTDKGVWMSEGTLKRITDALEKLRKLDQERLEKPSTGETITKSTLRQFARSMQRVLAPHEMTPER